MRIAAAVALAVSLDPRVTAASSRKVEIFRRQIYDRKPVIKPYAVVDRAGLLRESPSAASCLDRARRFHKSLAPLVGDFFALPEAEAMLERRDRYRQPMLYLEGPQYFDKAIDLAHAQRRVEELMRTLIAADRELATIEVYRNGTRAFSKSFELALGLEAQPDIDHYRIATPMVQRLLPTVHGSRGDVGDDTRIGFVEDRDMYQLTLPLVVDRFYVADVAYTFLKVREGI
jgi:hypothetical protein